MRILLMALVALLASDAGAQSSALVRYLARVEPATLIPGGEAFGEPEGEPPVVPVLAGGERIGYAYLASDFVDATGYSGKPIHILVGIDLDGVIRGARLMEHHEPIVLVGIPEAEIERVISGYAGRNAVASLERGAGRRKLDAVSGATVTVMVIDDAILSSAAAVTRRLGLGGLEPRDTGAGGARRLRVRMTDTGVRDWRELVAEGAVRRLKLTNAQINEAFRSSGDAAAAARPEAGDPDAPFIELFAALASIPPIGRTLLGEAEYRNLQRELEPGQHAILLASRGTYSYKGSGYVRGGIFDRFQIVQGTRSIRFRDRDHKRLRRIAAPDAPRMREVDLFRIPVDSGFDPARPWRLELLVSRATGPRTKAYLTFSLDYRLPERYLEPVPGAERGQSASAPSPVAAPARSPLWQRLWREKRGQIAVLSVALGVLTLIFFFQDFLVRRPRLSATARISFLLFTTVWIGFYAKAQLSIVNILTVLHALVTGFDWGYFLMEPLIFILWGSVAAALVFWGRGAFCGWLCPFGALQELLNRLARLLRIPQYQVPWGVHERLWALKYVLFLGLFGLSLHSLALAERFAEVEPFKTAIILRFDRPAPYVFFAGGLLAAGLFVERFYCRYLCALGAGLAIPAKLRIFDWLKRYRQCGQPCQRCRNECMVQAIHPEGHINVNECLYCLHCQELYYDEHRCPVMIAKRERRERRNRPVPDGDAAAAGRRRGEQILAEVRAGREQLAREGRPGRET